MINLNSGFFIMFLGALLLFTIISVCSNLLTAIFVFGFIGGIILLVVGAIMVVEKKRPL